MSENIYDRFEKLLKRDGVTTYQVSKATGISTASFTGWKKGKWNFKPDKLQKFVTNRLRRYNANILGLVRGYFFYKKT